MNKRVLLSLIAGDLDPFFSVEITILFGVMIANYSMIGLLEIQPGQTQEGVVSFAISLFKAAYVPFILALTLVIYSMARTLEDGRFLTYISFPYSVRKVTSYMFTYSAIYPGVLLAAAIAVDSWAFSFSTWPLVPAVLIFYITCFSILFESMGLFLATLTRSPVLAGGILGSLYIFIIPTTIHKNIKSALMYAIAGPNFLKARVSSNSLYIYGGIFEVIMGIALLLLSFEIIRRRNLRPVGR